MKIIRQLLTLSAVLLLSACAAYSLVPSNERVSLKNGLSVQPPHAWNRADSVNEPNLVLWTMDGPLLNTLGFVPGLENNISILKPQSGKEPIPVFKSTMAANDVMELFEATLMRSTETGAIVKTSNLRPATLGGHPGFRFDFTLVNQADDIERRGVAAGTIHNGRLYLIFFHAARLHYFPNNQEEVEAIIASARM